MAKILNGEKICVWTQCYLTAALKYGSKIYDHSMPIYTLISRIVSQIFGPQMFYSIVPLERFLSFSLTLKSQVYWAANKSNWSLNMFYRKNDKKKEGKRKK